MGLPGARCVPASACSGAAQVSSSEVFRFLSRTSPDAPPRRLSCDRNGSGKSKRRLSPGINQLKRGLCSSSPRCGGMRRLPAQLCRNEPEGQHGSPCLLDVGPEPSREPGPLTLLFKSNQSCSV